MSFKVVVPDWAIDRERRLGLVVSLRPTEAGDDEELLDLPMMPLTARMACRSVADAWASTACSISTGASRWVKRSSARRVRSPVRHQSPLIKLHGRWVDVDLEAARAAADFLKENPPAR